MKIIEVSSDKIFFTSDTHFGHETLLHFNGRPYKDAEEMDAALIENWNAKVPVNGLVYVLGDIGETDDERIIEIFNQLNGSKVLIRGNHDVTYEKETLDRLFTEIYDLLEIEIFDPVESKLQKIILCHYPMFDWNNFHEGSWQLFGHIHTRGLSEFNTLKRRLFAQQYDVGVDGNQFSPISYNELREIIKKQITDNSFKQSNYY